MYGLRTGQVPARSTLVVRLSPDDYGKLARAADELALPMSGLVRMLLRQHFTKLS